MMVAASLSKEPRTPNTVSLQKTNDLFSIRIAVRRWRILTFNAGSKSRQFARPVLRTFRAFLFLGRTGESQLNCDRARRDLM